MTVTQSSIIYRYWYYLTIYNEPPKTCSKLFFQQTNERKKDIPQYFNTKSR